ncbi:hypothetical protein GSI_04991 [Ganoderma sinense ZZ0214-1]|uniref:Uncharacterized protein n=1 Tax=Ganoderma sinense ZZ0214-1 TaxID=1077348 RepID=A0A2G8SGI9_9APHY|nr:hypothetical protein GSI_04991 [Ganoderma sinense ZZ0214-1]
MPCSAGSPHRTPKGSEDVSTRLSRKLCNQRAAAVRTIAPRSPAGLRCRNRPLEAAAGEAHRCGDDVGTTQEGRRAGTVTDPCQYDEGGVTTQTQDVDLPSARQAKPARRETRIKWKSRRTAGTACGSLNPPPGAGAAGDVMGIRRTHRSESLTPEGPHRQGTAPELCRQAEGAL